jgi:hypothetical protein
MCHKDGISDNYGVETRALKTDLQVADEKRKRN